MAGSDRRSLGIDRRLSTRLSIAPSHDEDYDLEAMGISDGFSPSHAVDYHGMMGQQTPNARAPPPPRPSSTAKPPATDTFALRHDGGMGTDMASTSSSASAAGSSSIPTRASSISTDMEYIRPESPYRGPTGPSHSYQMYSQETRLARTASIATTSTAAVTEGSYAGPSGPTHPYGMYPQNIVAESEEGEPSSLPPPVPVGFPGRNNNYQRRLGPDGEEAAGIIGPDGHTEELPPYTQYPDEAFARKTCPVVAPAIPATTSSIPPVSIPPVAVASGAGGIGLATRNPEFASQEDLSTPPSRGSIVSESSGHQVNTAAADAAGLSEKKELKNWQKAARRKVCGIVPVWVFGIVAISFILFGVILGTVFAVLKATHKKDRKDNGDNRFSPPPEQVLTLTTTFDATPLASVPTGTPSLPAGTYSLPIGTPSLSQSTCLENTAQSNAWACNIPMGPGPLQMTITQIPDSSNPLSNNELLLNYGDQALTSFAYGAQAPTFSQEQVLRLVNDVDETQRGPAWWFQMPYNKVVILPDTELNMPNQKRANDNIHERGGGAFGRKGVIQSGENAWFCYWNGTLLEAFIYPNQSSVYGSKAGSASSASTTSAAASSTVAGSASTSISTGGQTGNGGKPFTSYVPITLPYGKVVKIEEHRMSKGPQVIPPYCELNKVISGGILPVRNSTGQITRIFLNETATNTFGKRDPYDHELENEKREHYFDQREAGSEKSCGCVWLYT